MIENEQQYYSTKIKALEFEKTLGSLENDIDNKRKENLLLFDCYISAVRNKLIDLREEIDRYELNRGVKNNSTLALNGKSLDSSKDLIIFKEIIKFLAGKETIGLSLIFGGIILLVYFLSIRFIPDLDIGSIPVFLGAVAIIGIIFYFIICYILISPGIFLHNYLQIDKNLIYLWVRKKQLPVFAFSALLSFPLILIIVLYLCFNASLPSLNIFKPALVLLALFILSCIYSYLCRERISLAKLHRISLAKLLRLFLLSLVIFSITCFPFAMIISIIFKHSQNCTNNEYASIALFSSLFGVVMVNEFIIIKPLLGSDSSNSFVFKIVKFVVVPLTFFVILTSSFNRFVVIPEIIVEIFGWRNTQNASLIVGYEGCQAIMQIDNKILREQCIKTKNFYKITNLQILSSVGKSYFLRFPKEPPLSKSDCKNLLQSPSNKQYVDFTFPSSYIKSWSRK